MPRGRAAKKELVDTKILENWNTRVRTEHDKLVAQILVLRPDWSEASLRAVARTWGDLDNPGLYDILRTIETADALVARFNATKGDRT